MPDFDLTQLATDIGSICSVTYSGEAFRTGGATYYGVFSQNDRTWTFEDIGHRVDDKLNLTVPLATWTPTVNALVYRPFDTITYRVTDFKPDLQAYEITLSKPTAS